MPTLSSTYFAPLDRRILLITGHYGSGKTEFSLSLALLLAAERHFPYRRIAVVDLDIANPYFRSRERKDLLARAGVQVYGSCYEHEITAELPALSAEVRAPLEEEESFVIVDAGGDASGARVLHQFRQYVQNENSLLLAVINANRPETNNAAGALAQIAAIEDELGMGVGALVNNCHLLRETSAEDVARGHRLCRELCERTGKTLFCDCYPAPLLQAGELYGVGPYLLPMGMYMRDTYLDK